jgi:hypothetical protein
MRLNAKWYQQPIHRFQHLAKLGVIFVGPDHSQGWTQAAL